MTIAERIASKKGLILAVALIGAGATQYQRIVKTAMGSEAAKTARPSAPSRKGLRAEGRLVTYPGAMVTVGTEISGRLRALRVHERDRVKKGDVIAEIAADEQRAAVDEAHARAREAEVDVSFATAELDRTRTLWASGSVPFTLLDKADHDRDAARARRTSELAAAQRLSAAVAKARIAAPIDGIVLSREAEEGETIAAGAELVTIADLTRTRVEAEIDEFDAGRVAIGQAVTIAAEGQPGSYRGHVEEIPDQVVSRRLKPQDPAHPSDTRVLLVKVALNEPTPIKLGQRVEVEVETGEK